MNKLTIFELTGCKNLDDLLEQKNHGANINTQDENGDTALIFVSIGGDIDICKVLLETGADVNIKNKEGDNALIEASASGNIDVCKLLIEHGANVNIQNNEGKTALIKAATRDIYILLIENGADVNIQDHFGFTALIYASNNGEIDICKLLLENGADINLQNDDGETALISACRYQENVEVCKLLIENGANIDIKDKTDQTAIYYMKQENIYIYVEPYKILGLKYFKNVFREHAEENIDIFKTTLYSQELEIDDIKANIEMFYSTVVSRMTDNDINENVEL